LRQIRWQKLQRYKSTKFGVLGLVDHTHSTRAELLDNAVMRNDLPDHGKQNLKLEGTGKSMKGKELTPKRMDGYGPHPPEDGGSRPVDRRESRATSASSAFHCEQIVGSWCYPLGAHPGTGEHILAHVSCRSPRWDLLSQQQTGSESDQLQGAVAWTVSTHSIAAAVEDIYLYPQGGGVLPLRA
jgi:hypothetical protein